MNCFHAPHFAKTHHDLTEHQNQFSHLTIVWGRSPSGGRETTIDDQKGQPNKLNGIRENVAAHCFLSPFRNSISACVTTCRSFEPKERVSNTDSDLWKITEIRQSVVI